MDVGHSDRLQQGKSHLYAHRHTCGKITRRNNLREPEYNCALWRTHQSTRKCKLWHRRQRAKAKSVPKRRRLPCLARQSQKARPCGYTTLLKGKVVYWCQSAPQVHTYKMLNSDVQSVIDNFCELRPNQIREWCDTTLLARWIGEWGRRSEDFEYARSRLIQLPRSLRLRLFLNTVDANHQIVLQELMDRG